jgi:hypothetical protein
VTRKGDKERARTRMAQHSPEIGGRSAFSALGFSLLLEIREDVRRSNLVGSLVPVAEDEPVAEG